MRTTTWIGLVLAASLGLACGKETNMTTKLQAHIAGEGRPLALVGGGLTGWASWEPFQARLQRTRRVARIQPLSVQLGLENRRLPEGYGVDLESDALAATLDDFAGQPVDVVAWSYGAEIALDWALDHPDRVRTLTLIEPPAFWVLDETGTLDAEAKRAMEEMLGHYHGRGLAEDVSEEQLAVFVGQAGLVPPGKRAEELPQWPAWVKHRRSLRTGDAAWRHRDRAERLRGFDKPVLLVTGRGTAHVLRRITDGLAQTFPHARLLELEGGHAPHIVEPEPFVEALAALQR